MPRYGRKRRTRRGKAKKTYKRKRSGRKRVGRGRRVGAKGAGRTLQIRTLKPMSTSQFFVIDQTYILDPKPDSKSTTGFPGFPTTAMHFQWKANQLKNLVSYVCFPGNEGTSFRSQGGTSYGPGHISDMPGYDLWKDKFQHAIVISSKITATFQLLNTTTGDTINNPPPDALTEVPTTQPRNGPITFFMTKSSVANAVPFTSQAGSIAHEPLLVRKNLIPNTGTSQSCTLSMTYSAKRFDGLGKVGLEKFAMQMPGGAGSYQDADEETYFNVGLCDTRGAAAPEIHQDPQGQHDKLPQVLCQMKVAYKVKFYEPSDVGTPQDAAFPYR